MTENDPRKKKPRSKMSLKSLRLSLKYRPEMLKLILKMRQCIRKRNFLIKSLKHRLKKMEPDNVEDTNTNKASKKGGTLDNFTSVSQSLTNAKTKEFQDSSTQTSSDVNDDTKSDKTKSEVAKIDAPKENTGWNIKENGETEKSIADQVKEAAQSALQDTGMVYVESAGMYYDYKTGYYYNSELGLYYHSDTGCYYYYSDDKQFVFHSYPDMSKVNSSLIAHQNKKARKLKRERKTEDDIDNLTKHLSQDKEEDATKPKKPRKSIKTKKERKEKRKDKKPRKVNKKKVNIEGIEEKKEETEDQGEKVIIARENDSTQDETCKTESTDVLSVTETVEDSIPKQTETNDNDAIDIFETIDNSEVKTETKGENECNNTNSSDNNNEIEKDKAKMEIESETKDQDSEELKKDEIKEIKKDEIEEEEEELEDGECSESESEDSESESDASTSTVSDEDSIAKHHPPCMRVIVRETKLPKLKVGSLFLITKDGGTIGREGEKHAILLKDHNVSRNHLDIRYDVAKKAYLATDLGSKNGTILNGVRMSESQEISLPLDVLHGSTMQLGETKLLCHIHPGHSTCGQCEPGLLMQVEEEKKTAYTRTVSVKKQYELELARLKNIYVPQRLAIEEKPYNDRAQARRETVGSTNHAEKTQSSDLDTSIAPDNKGFKLLQKMGWSEGEGLGKDSQGDTEPVPLVTNEGKAGLGTCAVAPPSNAPKPRLVKNNLAAATMRLATRTKMLQPPAKAFQNEDDDEFE